MPNATMMPDVVTIEEHASVTWIYAETPLAEQAVPQKAAELSRRARNIIGATIVSGFVFLGVVGAWLWYGARLYQNCDPAALGLHHFGL